MNTLIKAIDSKYLIGYLEEKLQEEKEFLAIKRDLLTDDQLVAYDSKIARIEDIMVELASCKIKHKLSIDCSPQTLVEVLSFLLNEFFASTAFRKKHQNEALLNKMVFQTAQVITELNKLPPQGPLSF